MELLTITKLLKAEHPVVIGISLTDAAPRIDFLPTATKAQIEAAKARALELVKIPDADIRQLAMLKRQLACLPAGIDLAKVKELVEAAKTKKLTADQVADAMSIIFHLLLRIPQETRTDGNEYSKLPDQRLGWFNPFASQSGSG